MEERGRAGRPRRSLEPDELEVYILKRIAEDATDAQIAREIFCSVATLRKRIYALKKRQNLWVGRVGLARFYDALPDEVKVKADNDS